MAALSPPPGAPVTRVNLFLSCLHLPNFDVASKSDPSVTVALRDSRGQRVLGTTEVVKDNLNPKFATAISLDYYFEEVQTLTFEVFDTDAHSKELMCTTSCTVGDIFGSRGQELIRPLDVHRHGHSNAGGKRAAIVVRGEQVQGAAATVHFNLSGTHLDKKDFGPFAKSDPYLLLYKEAANGTRTLVHRTNTIMNTLNPVWEPFSLSLSVLCNGDIKMPLYIEVFDYDKHSADDLIGICRTNLEALSAPTGIKSLELIEPNKQKKKGSSYKNSGILNILRCQVVPEYTFLDYLAGGTQLNLMVGIDYTASNGEPSDPRSLHFRNPSGQLNQYETAIINVGNILMPYDYDGQVPAYGFGAMLPVGVSHCFAINGNPTQPEVPGVNGVLGVYRNSFTFAKLHGPTNFAPLIRQASTIAQTYHAMAQDVSTYLLLMIITDGEITDMDETLAAVVDASALPMSIVIIGVGNADFTKMNILDGDGGLLRSPRGGVAVRDIVQFVPFNQYPDPAKLAAATLAEIPGQFISYMKSRNIVPRTRIVADIQVLESQMQAVTVTTTTTTAVPVAAPQ